MNKEDVILLHIFITEGTKNGTFEAFQKLRPIVCYTDIGVRAVILHWKSLDFLPHKGGIGWGLVWTVKSRANVGFDKYFVQFRLDGDYFSIVVEPLIKILLWNEWSILKQMKRV